MNELNKQLNELLETDGVDFFVPENFVKLLEISIISNGEIFIYKAKNKTLTAQMAVGLDITHANESSNLMNTVLTEIINSLYISSYKKNIINIKNIESYIQNFKQQAQQTDWRRDDEQ